MITVSCKGGNCESEESINMVRKGQRSGCTLQQFHGPVSIMSAIFKMSRDVLQYYKRITFLTVVNYWVHYIIPYLLSRQLSISTLTVVKCSVDTPQLPHSSSREQHKCFHYIVQEKFNTQRMCSTCHSNVYDQRPCIWIRKRAFDECRNECPTKRVPKVDIESERPTHDVSRTNEWELLQSVNLTTDILKRLNDRTSTLQMK